MEQKNIIIISAAGVLIILAAAWFIFDPFSSGEGTTVESPIVTQEQTVPQTAEKPAAEQKKISPQKEKKPKQTSENGNIYIVKEGDTLQRIAVEKLGDEKYWINIFAANEPDIDWYDVISPGQKLIIPDVN